jgi:hypothetical protein
MDKDAYQAVLTEAATRANNYLRTIQERHVGVPQDAVDKLALLGGNLPERGENPRNVLQLLDDIGSPATIATMGRRFFGGSSVERSQFRWLPIGLPMRRIRTLACSISHRWRLISKMLFLIGCCDFSACR